MESETNTETHGAEGAQTEAKAEPMLPQSKVNDIVAREVAKIERRFKEQLAALEPRAKLAEELEQKAREAEEAKLSATQRAELERKREREAYEKRIADLDGLAKTERAKRHDALVRHAAASRVSTVAARLFNSAIAPDVESLVAGALRVEEVDGREVVTIRLGAEGDTEPLETGWQKFVDAKLNNYFKAEGGAGARHGSGTGGGSSSWAGLSASDKIAAGLQARRTG